MSFAALAAADSGDSDPADTYFSNKNLKLTKQEKDAIAIAQRWRNSSGTGMAPVAGADGTIRFLFGAQQPGIVCAVLQVCDVELQAGEVVNSIHLGDTARWIVEPAITGGGATEVQHLIIKPMDVGLETSLIVTTNRRTYHIRLRSHRTEFMPRIAFTYTEDAVAKWDAIKTREAKEKQERTIPQTNEYLGDLSFAYDVSGSASWKPVRVYNNGTKTIIQMPGAMAQTEAPTLLVVRKDGGLFTDAETVMVNYRIQGDRYIVDTVFDKAILIAGVGSGQDRVTITREK
jgi:type IV secretion system protein VirB9